MHGKLVKGAAVLAAILFIAPPVELLAAEDDQSSIVTLSASQVCKNDPNPGLCYIEFAENPMLAFLKRSADLAANFTGCFATPTGVQCTKCKDQTLLPGSPLTAGCGGGGGFGGFGGFGAGGGTGGGEGGGGGGNCDFASNCSEPPTPPDSDQESCQAVQNRDRPKDTIAETLRKRILKKVKINADIEYGAYVVETASGSITGLRVVDGFDGAISVAELRQTLFDAGYDQSDVRGFVHYHNPTYYDPSRPDVIPELSNQRNRAPSWDGRMSYGSTGPAAGTGDYAVSALFSREAVAAGANQTTFDEEFTHYIIGPDRRMFQWNGVAPHPALHDGVLTEDEVSVAAKDAANKC